VNAIFRFVLAVGARKFEIQVQVHAFCVLSNHYHLVVTDPDARLPAFMQFFNSLVGRAVNTSLGRWEAFWDSSGYSAVTLVSPRDIVDKAAYVLANPVKARLVRRGKEWPGLWSGVHAVGGPPICAARPKDFFDVDGDMPEQGLRTCELWPPQTYPGDPLSPARAFLTFSHILNPLNSHMNIATPWSDRRRRTSWPRAPDRGSAKPKYPTTDLQGRSRQRRRSTGRHSLSVRRLAATARKACRTLQEEEEGLALESQLDV
jgi:REP element-mobilizing transposase RayT